ncbi:PAX-interacting protein 1 [Tupaia chinensis]|uniref:PAX-interacting protein 1 n=1 Tax=Tupaia chinensis TaxID=246437 RepID=L9L494_TUPCH|nr:PAX-interacting protein 1 [Tupaia chinensis]
MAARGARQAAPPGHVEEQQPPCHYALPEEGFLLGCVFAIADYPEQMSDKQLLATWKRIIQVHGGAVEPTLTSRCTHLLCESQVSSTYAQAIRERKRCVTAHWLNTVLKKKKMGPPHRALHFPVAFPPGGKPCAQHIISVTGFVDSDRDDLKLMAYLAGAKYTGYLCRSNTVLICREPTGLKYEKAKEWRIPCVNAQWLGDILLGNFEALRHIQYSRYTAFTLQDPFAPTQHLVLNLLGEQASRTEDQDPFAPTQHLVLNLLDAWRVPLKVSAEQLMGGRPPPALKPGDVTAVQPSKRARIEDIPPPTKKLTPELTPFVLFTGFEPAQKLYILGGEVAESAQKCTHLIASKVTRTVKFLTAISVVKHIVTPEWLEECFKCQKFIEGAFVFADEQNYTLRDAEAEVLFSFSLEESLKRAHVSPLFKAKYFYITPGICPSLSTMKAIVECAGGKVLAKQPSFRKLLEHRQSKCMCACTACHPCHPSSVHECVYGVSLLSILCACVHVQHAAPAICPRYATFSRVPRTSVLREFMSAGHGGRCTKVCAVQGGSLTPRAGTADASEADRPGIWVGGQGKVAVVSMPGALTLPSQWVLLSLCTLFLNEHTYKFN